MVITCFVRSLVDEFNSNGASLISDVQSTFFPLILLLLTFLIASLGPWWTVLALLSLPISIRIIARQFRIKDASHFYFAFAMYSMLITYLVFESVTQLGKLTWIEYCISLVLGGVSLFLIFLTRHQCNTAATLPDPNVSSKEYRNYDFCKKCRRIIAKRDHHCVWLNTCIGAENKRSFISVVMFSAIWLIYNFFLNTTSICYPRYLFSGVKLNDGTSVASRWLLIPSNCPDLYESGQFLITIIFVVSIYGLGVAVLLILVLLHQFRLVLSGKTYLEHKFGQKKVGRNECEDNVPLTLSSQTYY